MTEDFIYFFYIKSSKISSLVRRKQISEPSGRMRQNWKRRKPSPPHSRWRSRQASRSGEGNWVIYSAPNNIRSILHISLGALGDLWKQMWLRRSFGRLIPASPELCFQESSCSRFAGFAYSHCSSASSPVPPCSPVAELARPWLASDQIHLDLGLHCLTHEDGRPARFASVSPCPNEKLLDLLSASGMNPFWRRMRHKRCLAGAQNWSKETPSPAVITVGGDSTEPLSQKKTFSWSIL